MKRIAILGSTGSIGVNTLDVISGMRDKFEIIGLSADSNIELLSRQAKMFSPKAVALRDPAMAKKIKGKLPHKTKAACGIDGLEEIVSRADVDLVVFAISGSACIRPLLKAIDSRKQVALANKEAMVSAGSIIMRAAKGKGVKILPVDSEHSAIFQCLEGRDGALAKIYLTGSGGPLLNVEKNKFDRLSREFVLKHPKWRMGRKISVDSATMMNKGLEIIEARWLFDIDEKAIEVLIHPEAIIHSMVELIDSSVFAQLATPDMRLPIQYALTYPERVESMTRKLNFAQIEKLSFRRPDVKKFPCLGFAREAVRMSGTYPAVLNAADEEVVRKYLVGEIKFSDIPKIIEKVLGRHKRQAKSQPSLDDIFEAEGWAKEEARSFCH